MFGLNLYLDGVATFIERAKPRPAAATRHFPHPTGFDGPNTYLSPDRRLYDWWNGYARPSNN